MKKIIGIGAVVVCLFALVGFSNGDVHITKDGVVIHEESAKNVQTRYGVYDRNGNQLSNTQSAVNPLQTLPNEYQPIAKTVAASGKKAMTERVNNEPITKEKELPFVMGFTSDITDDLGNPHDALLGDWSDASKEEIQKTVFESYKRNLGDIEHKLKRLEQLKKYAADYPLIESKLVEIESTFKEAKAKGATASGVDESFNLYEKGVNQAKALLNAFEVGQELQQ